MSDPAGELARIREHIRVNREAGKQLDGIASII